MNNHPAATPTVETVQYAPTNQYSHRRCKRPVGNPRVSGMIGSSGAFVSTIPTVNSIGLLDRRSPAASHSKLPTTISHPAPSAGRARRTTRPATKNPIPHPRNSAISPAPNTGGVGLRA